VTSGPFFLDKKIQQTLVEIWDRFIYPLLQHLRVLLQRRMQFPPPALMPCRDLVKLRARLAEEPQPAAHDKISVRRRCSLQKRALCIFQIELGELSQGGLQVLHYLCALLAGDCQLVPARLARTPEELGPTLLLGRRVHGNAVGVEEPRRRENVVDLLIECLHEPGGPWRYERRRRGIGAVEVERDVERVAHKLAGGGVVDDGERVEVAPIAEVRAVGGDPELFADGRDLGEFDPLRLVLHALDVQRKSGGVGAWMSFDQLIL
jgi:hypothetical protein